MVEINHRLLERDTLDSMLAEFVSREGTDYGEVEVSFEDKKKQLLHLLDSGHAVIIHHASDGFCDVVEKTP